MDEAMNDGDVPVVSVASDIVASDVGAETRTATIAPWWHTAAVLFGLLVLALLSGSRVRGYTGAQTPHVPTYASQMLMSWMLFGAMVAGVYRRGDFFFSTMRARAKAKVVEVGRAFAIYFGFGATVYACVLAFVFWSMALHGFHDHPSAAPATSHAEISAKNGGAVAEPASPEPTAMPDPMGMKVEIEKELKRLHFDSRTIASIGPQTFPQLMVWFLLSITAGFCEEHVFRGYMLRQAMALFGRANMRPWMMRAIAVIVTSLIFGSLHLYEGVGGAVVVTVLGALYAVLALWFGNLRAVMLAHFMQDFFAGVLLFGMRGHLPH